MSKQIRKWIKSKKSEIKNQNLLENLAVGANEEDQELEVLNNQMKTLIAKMKNIIARTSNKNKGYAILHEIGKSIQDAMGITDMNMRKAVLGQLQSQKKLNQ